MNPLANKNRKVELTKGGANVDGQFYTRDNMITNRMVKEGKLPASSLEIYPQKTVEPRITADKLTNPPVVPNLSVPQQATIPQSAIGRANNVVNETQNIITAKTKESEKRQELLDTLAASGDQQTLATLSQQKLDEYGVGDNLKELKDIQLQLTDMNTASDLTKTNIAGAAGQTMGQAQREVTQEDRENAVRSTGLAARAAVLQGNIETGRTLAKDAVDIAYQDRMLKNQNLITQLNEYGKIADEQTKQLVDQAKAEAEAEIKADDEMKANIADAIVNGASQQEIATLNKQLPPNATAQQIAADRAQKNQLAQSVIGRGTGEMRGLDMASKRASIRASNASAALNEAELVAEASAAEAAAKGILTPDQAKVANDLNKDFEGQEIVKQYNQGVQKIIVLEDVLANGIDGVQDLQLVYDFMKSVDPQSVVRETEFANAAKTGNIFQGAYTRFNKGYFGQGGFLPDDVKASFIDSARSSFDAKNTQYFNVKGEYAKRINNTLGVQNGADYLTAYEAAAPLTQTDFDIASALENATDEDLLYIMQNAQMTNSTPSR
jgi:hypothetical protein